MHIIKPAIKDGRRLRQLAVACQLDEDWAMCTDAVPSYLPAGKDHELARPPGHEDR